MILAFHSQQFVSTTVEQRRKKPVKLQGQRGTGERGPRTKVAVQNDEHHCPHIIQHQLQEVLRNSLCEPGLIQALLFRTVQLTWSAVCQDAMECLRRVRLNQRAKQRKQIPSVSE